MVLTKGQSHPILYNFEGLSPGYLFAKNHNYAVNNVWDIVKNDQKVDIFQIYSK